MESLSSDNQSVKKNILGLNIRLIKKKKQSFMILFNSL